MRIRLLRADPHETDFTPAQLKDFRARRAAQNARLVDLATGKIAYIPMFDFVPLPGSRYMEPVAAENDLQNRIIGSSGILYSHRIEATRIREFNGTIIPEGVLAEPIRQEWMSSGPRILAEVQEVLDSGADLWFNESFALYASANLDLREFGLSLETLTGEG